MNSLWIGIVCGVLLASILTVQAYAADSPDPAQDVVRLKVPLKYIKPGAGPGGINLEVESYGFIDETGKVVIQPQWDAVADFHEGLAHFTKDGKGGFIDQSGKVVIPPIWDKQTLFGDDEERFSEGFASVERNGKWGYIDQTGKLVIPLHWDEAGYFGRWRSPRRHNINKSGRLGIYRYHRKSCHPPAMEPGRAVP